MASRLETSPQVLVAALVVSPSKDDRKALRPVFAQAKVKWESVPTLEGAFSWLVRCGPPQVLLCERELADGNWQVLFHQTESLPRPPKFIVSSRFADDYLWAEVLNVGGHDVLSTPFKQGEVARVVRYALESWKQRWQTDTPPYRTAAAADSLSGGAVQMRSAS